jgi:ElaB/YqjD/DUF883 family membrane-anchored ribosome-binding protein
MDIVDVLRSVGGWPDEVARQHFSCGEIADEIGRLRAEVASLKSDLESYMRIANDEANENVSLTQQLAAAKEYAERLIVALEEIADDSAHAAAQDALALPKPWDAIRKSEG